MNDRLQLIHHHPLHIPTKKKVQPPSNQSASTFRKILLEVQCEPLKISKHAQQRLTERNIKISEEQWMKIQEKILEARQKGICDSLVLINHAALIINAKNNTVITAMNRQEAQSQLFTNINGAIILE
ncbi:flagellar operon protein [Anoxybacillus vitaminiphilus]|uniref:Flagellar operon protein n=1 Tax=Paranoxybacillus vitaminiphilus TaxID=581036 RepID=A0A327YUH4_9BACL|nr:TIGR02530 family flagellar biosynthesis protein [Anoxybacillus vitaminiphilus]RAK23375.1 flagellar operon protein [Anoxybacillus vitaminiphilus]